MKLYRPVLIESAEQAEALPEETIATHDEHWPAVRCTPNRWESSARDMKHAEMIGWTALVPIEAEEEWKTLHEGSWHLKADEDDARNDATAYGTRRRYTTDWEEA